MSSSQFQEVFLGHTFEACIAGVGSQGQIGRGEPMVQGLGMNSKQSSTRSDRKRYHDQDSFPKRTKEFTRRPPPPGNVPELPDFQDIVGKEGHREQRPPLSVEHCNEARISQPSGDAWYGDSWHDFGGSDATTTRPAPSAPTKRWARSAVRADGALQGSSGEAQDVGWEWQTQRAPKQMWSSRWWHKSRPGRQASTRQA